MHLEYRLNINDYWETYRTQVKGVYSCSFCMLAALTIGIPLIRLLFPQGVTEKALLDLLTNFVVFIVLLPVWYWSVRFPINRLWRRQTQLHDPISAEVNEEGWLFSSPTIETQANWQVFTHFRETKNLFMLYQSKVCTNFVPKRAFETEEQMNEFRSLLQRKIVK